MSIFHREGFDTINLFGMKVKLPCIRYHYSNPDSQGALIRCTSRFPKVANRDR